MRTRLPLKKDVALALLERSTVFVHLDPRREAVSVPAWFKRQPQLVLQVGYNMPVPIRDLNLDGDGVQATLSFNRAPHCCYVPWSAIYALVGEDGRGMVWPDDVPPEVAAQVQVQATAKSPHLHAVGEGKAAESSKGDRAVDGAIAPGSGANPKAAPSPRVVRRRKAKQAPSLVEGQLEKLKAEPKARQAERPPPVPPSKSKSKRELPPYLRVVK
jgi:stringent starvation protein B